MSGGRSAVAPAPRLARDGAAREAALPWHHGVLPAVCLTVTFLAGLAWVRLHPVADQPVAALFAPGLSLPAAFARVAATGAEWRVLRAKHGLAGPLLLLRQASRSDGSEANLSRLRQIPGLLLLVNAAGALGCDSMKSRKEP